MRRKFTFCILGLVLLGMLCVPVAGNWQFCIIDEVIGGLDHTSINGIYTDRSYTDHGGIIDVVNVSDDLDSVTVKIEVLAGKTTTLNITRSYIRGLEQTGFRTPALYAWGGTLTYDVYGGYIGGDIFYIDPRSCPQDLSFNTRETYAFYVTDHLKLRGLRHRNIGEWVLPGALLYPPDQHIREIHINE